MRFFCLPRSQPDRDQESDNAAEKANDGSPEEPAERESDDRRRQMHTRSRKLAGVVCSSPAFWSCSATTDVIPRPASNLSSAGRSLTFASRRMLRTLSA